MSDRDLICKNCGKEIEARGWTHDDSIFCDVPGLQYAEAAPVEPPVLSRAAETLVKTKAIVEERLRSAREREANESTRLVNGTLDVHALEDILESLSQEDG